MGADSVVIEVGHLSDGGERKRLEGCMSGFVISFIDLSFLVIFGLGGKLIWLSCSF